MKVYVWLQIANCSTAYHCEGGVVAFAETEKRARELANANPGCCIKEDEMPDTVRDVIGGEEAVYLMPDAGCC